MERPHGGILAAAAGLVLVAFAGAVAVSGGQVRPGAAGPGAPAATGPVPTMPAATPGSPVREPASDALARIGEVFGGVLALILAVCLVAIAVGLVLLVRWLARRRSAPRRPPEREPADEALPAAEAAAEVRSALRRGLSRLAEPGTDPRGAVIACWLALEETAAAAGLARQPSDSPTDLVTRLLAHVEVATDDLDELAGLYRAARFGPAEVSAHERDEARRALARVEHALTPREPAGRSAGGGVGP